MELIDTHAHLQEEAFAPDRDEVLARARQAGVVAMFVVGFSVDSSQRAVDLAAQHPDLRSIIGLQPNYLLEMSPAAWEDVLTLARHPSVVAIGETGIDLYWKTTPLDLQQDYFQRHMALARQLDLPFVVHSRNADAEVVAELQRAAEFGPLRGVMHSFAGSAETATTCLELGLHLSFSGMVTSKGNKALREIASTVPAERILIETDCPYLAPSPHRGQRNEPALLKFTCDAIAHVRGISSAELAAQTTRNARELFRLS